MSDPKDIYQSADPGAEIIEQNSKANRQLLPSFITSDRKNLDQNVRLGEKIDQNSVDVNTQHLPFVIMAHPNNLDLNVDLGPENTDQVYGLSPQKIDQTGDFKPKDTNQTDGQSSQKTDQKICSAENARNNPFSSLLSKWLLGQKEETNYGGKPHRDGALQDDDGGKNVVDESEVMEELLTAKTASQTFSITNSDLFSITIISALPPPPANTLLTLHYPPRHHSRHL
ncbi:hypothetical protein BJ508DRAFT_327451 [Ascobolus immersus RN42]|uniref:Uncharacterized protein n=1 Tax=Ascobolus immersus RN42 TaxID=1160509 RepID=A0A3N4I2K3_ASCIM|nr:hypothetical protein BJ508DRAFT_327451 [Ascobolus immersus RN42]